jgi:hypothetical protein
MNQPEIRADFKTRILAEVARTPAPVRRTEEWRAIAVVAASAGIALAIFEAGGGLVLGSRPRELVLGTSSCMAALAAVGLWLALHRGRSMLGRSRRALLVVPLVLPLLALVCKLTWSSRYAPGPDVWPGRSVDQCLVLGVMIGSAPLLALLFVRRGTDAIHAAVAGSSIGAAVGLVAACLLDLSCPLAGAAHVALGHLLPVGLFSLAGAMLGKIVLGPGEG